MASKDLGPRALEAEVQNKAGNKLVQVQDYAAARDCYSRAIEQVNSEPRYFNNRALCHLRLGEFASAVDDATRAMAGLDSTTEAHGKALHRRLKAYAEQGKWASANLDVVRYLNKATLYRPRPEDRSQIEEIGRKGRL